MTKLLFVSLAMILSGSAFAGADCVLSMDRTPCPGKEAEAYKPYSGQNPTTEPKEKFSAGAKKGKPITSKEDCLEEAAQFVKIVRKGTLSKKVATVTYAGAEVGKKEDTAACK